MQAFPLSTTLAVAPMPLPLASRVTSGVGDNRALPHHHGRRSPVGQHPSALPQHLTILSKEEGTPCVYLNGHWLVSPTGSL